MIPVAIGGCRRSSNNPNINNITIKRGNNTESTSSASSAASSSSFMVFNRPLSKAYIILMTIVLTSCLNQFQCHGRSFQQIYVSAALARSNNIHIGASTSVSKFASKGDVVSASCSRSKRFAPSMKSRQDVAAFISNSGSKMASSLTLSSISPSPSPSILFQQQHLSNSNKPNIMEEGPMSFYHRHNYHNHRLFSSSTDSNTNTDTDTDTDTDTEETSNNNQEENDKTKEDSEKKNSNYITTKNQGDQFHNKIDQESDAINYPKGMPDGFYIIQQYNVPDADTFHDMIQSAIERTKIKTDNVGVDADADADSDVVKTQEELDKLGVGITQEELDRLGITSSANVTLPIALMLLDPKEYPSFSKARKACRKGYIIIHRGPLDNDNNDDEIENSFNRTKSIRGRVADRVYPNDVIGRQVRMHGGFYPGLDTSKPPFDLPVVYEDDHFAIVNKPAGIVVYAQRGQGHGMMTVRAALPFALQPPKRGTLAIIRRPVSVHRLDKPTAGLLLIAKTKPAMIDLTKQFVERRIKKTYTAILNGIPAEPIESSITKLEAHELGVDVGYREDTNEKEMEEKWQLIDSPLDDGNSVKSAVTIWKPLQYVKSLKANNGILTKVEMKPKTGRYHQLRRHMAWIRECPIVGDKEYDGGGDAMDLRGRGLFLCSNKVTLDHPYYNTDIGRKEWETLPDSEKWANGMIALSNNESSDEDSSIVKVNVSIDLPGKFSSFLRQEEQRANKFSNDDTNIE